MREQRDRRRRGLALEAALESAEERNAFDVRALLADVARRRNAAIHAYDETRAELEGLIRQARDVGLSISEIADTLGMSRPSIYAALERPPESSDDLTAPAHVRGGPRTQPASTFVITRDSAGTFRWRLVAPNGRAIAESADAYSTAAQARKSIDFVKRHAAASPGYERV